MAWQQQAHRMLRNMIDQHYNHPAVILWGLGNEDDWPGEFPSEDQQAIRAFMSQLNDEAHTLDPTRLTSIRRCDFAKDIPDVYSPSIWAGWYRGRYTEYKSSSICAVSRVEFFFALRVQVVRIHEGCAQPGFFHFGKAVRAVHESG